VSSGEDTSSTVTVAPAGSPQVGASERPTAAGWILGLLAVVVLGILLPLLLVSSSERSSLNGYVVVVLWGICIFSAVRLGGFLVYRRARLILMAFHVFCYVFVGLTPLAQIAAGRFPNAAHFATAASINDDDIIARTATLFLVGIVAHEIAYLLGSRRRGRPSRRTPTSAESVRDLVAALNVPVVQFLCIAGVLISVIAVAQAGLAPFFTSREAADSALTEIGGDGASGLLWYRVSHAVPFAGLFLLLHLMRRDETKRTPGYLTLAVVLAVCNCIINNPLGNSRLWANVVLFGILSVFVDLRRPRAVLATTLGLTTAFLLVFPYADLTRRTGRSEALLTPVEEFSASGSFSAFQTAANGLRYVDDNSLTWGGQLLGGLFTLVPRSVWPGKPPDTGFLIDPVYNRAATMWTEMHINFGIVGVVLGLALLGVMARRCDDSFIAGRPWAMILVPILSTFYFILLRGTLSAAVGTLLPILLVLLLPLVVRGKPSGRAGRSRTSTRSVQRPSASSGDRPRSAVRAS
jgi:hypothetical protein